MLKAKKTGKGKKVGHGSPLFRGLGLFKPGCRELLLLAGVVFLPLLSGCVGNAVTETLDSAALNAPTDLMALETEESFADYSSLAAIPVPARSPQSSELALARTTNLPAVDAVTALAEHTAEKVTAEASNPQTAALDAPQAGQTVAPTTKKPPPVQQVSGPPKPVELVASAEAVAGEKALSQAEAQLASRPKPKKRTSFWSALFGSNRSSASKTSPSNTVTARAEKARPGTAALPGVKRDSALFGINTNEQGKSTGDNQDVQVASVGSFGRFRTVNGLVLQTEKVKVECFKPELMRLLRKVERRYGKKVMVTSGYRSPRQNRRAGGARNSTHIYCKAADIQVEGISKWDLAKYLRTVEGRGGVGTYCRTKSVHIDIGSVRDWHHPCRRSKSRVRKKKA